MPEFTEYDQYSDLVSNLLEYCRRWDYHIVELTTSDLQATGVRYYYDNASGESRWKAPIGWRVLPPGWFDIVDK